MRHLDTRLTQRTLQPEVEIGRIDADKHLRAPLQQSVAQLRSHRTQTRIFAHHLGIAANRQRLAMPPGIKALIDHRRAADPSGLQQGRITELAFEAAEHCGGKQVPGGLTGDHPEAEGSSRAGGHACAARGVQTAISGRCRG